MFTSVVCGNFVEPLRVMIFLLPAGPLVPRSTWVDPVPPLGSHSLRYLVTMTVSGPGLRDSHVFIVAYMNYMQFMRFDSDGTTQRIQARGPWVKQMGPAYLEMERRKVESYSHRAQENLRFAIQVYNQSDNVFNRLQHGARPTPPPWAP
uniref:MHC class I-like antigen recognition-like domain-containing protein n=1 Tax=Mus spicilegus TaxID=10103 RepID=A0A8C6H9H1_MUSSI